MLRSEFTGSVMVFAKEYQERTFYSIGLSKKGMDGNYINGYINASFRKGVVIPNQTKIEITKGWLDFYINKDKHTVPQIFVMEFETESQEAPEPQEEVQGFQQLDDDDCSLPF